jgi:hypothetical protein
LEEATAIASDPENGKNRPWESPLKQYQHVASAELPQGRLKRLKRRFFNLLHPREEG